MTVDRFLKALGIIAWVMLLIVFWLAFSSTTLAAKPDKSGRDLDGKPGWGPPPWAPSGTPAGQFNPNNHGGVGPHPVLGPPEPPEPEPEPEPEPGPEPPIVGPDGLPPSLPDTAMR